MGVGECMCISTHFSFNIVSLKTTNITATVDATSHDVFFICARVLDICESCSVTCTAHPGVGIAEMADKIRTSFGLVLPAAVFDGSVSKPTLLR